MAVGVRLAQEDFEAGVLTPLPKGEENKGRFDAILKDGCGGCWGDKVRIGEELWSKELMIGK